MRKKPGHVAMFPHLVQQFSVLGWPEIGRTAKFLKQCNSIGHREHGRTMKPFFIYESFQKKMTESNH
jgi:hypothetical protein